MGLIEIGGLLAQVTSLGLSPHQRLVLFGITAVVGCHVVVLLLLLLLLLTARPVDRQLWERAKVQEHRVGSAALAAPRRRWRWACGRNQAAGNEG